MLFSAAPPNPSMLTFALPRFPLIIFLSAWVTPPICALDELNITIPLSELFKIDEPLTVPVSEPSK